MMRTLTHAELHAALHDRSGLTSADAERAERAILAALMQACPPHVHGRFGSLAAPPRSRRAITSLDELVVDVALTLESSPAAALEAIEVACGAIAEAWSDADRRAVCAALPSDVAALFAPPEHASAIERAGAADVARRTLSSGQPGAQHPICSSPLSDGAHSLATGHPEPRAPSEPKR